MSHNDPIPESIRNCIRFIHLFHFELPRCRGLSCLGPFVAVCRVESNTTSQRKTLTDSPGQAESNTTSQHKTQRTYDVRWRRWDARRRQNMTYKRKGYMKGWDVEDVYVPSFKFVPANSVSLGGGDGHLRPPVDLRLVLRVIVTGWEV